VRLSVAGITVVLDATTILADAELVVEPGEFVGLVGPNGSGKSTLLRTIYRALRPAAGAVMIGDGDVWDLSPRQAARRTAAVIQESTGDFDLTTLEVVGMGRNPHKRAFDRQTADDARICNEALARVGMQHAAQRDFATLSGGEKQRVLLARALAQESQVLVLDEPTNHLDIRFQLELLDLVDGLGVTTIAAMHDLDLAARHCDRLYVLEHGRVVAGGPGAEVLTDSLVARVFGVRLHRSFDTARGCEHLSFARLELEPEPANSPA
jgi:iron complex transport system ATP-binding protein